MSINCWLLGLAPAQIAALLASPSLASDVVMVVQEDESRARFDELTRQMSPQQRRQAQATRAAFESTMKEARARTTQARKRIAALGSLERALGLDKSWHLLHYLLTGHVDPSRAPGALLLTGKSLGEDVGYGPPRLHGQSETCEFSQFLETQEVARLQARIDIGTLDRIGLYAIAAGPGPASEYEKGLRDQVGFYFPLLRDYVRTTSGKGYGLLVWMS